MIRNGKLRASIRSRGTNPLSANRRGKRLRLGAGLASLGLAAGAFNIAVVADPPDEAAAPTTGQVVIFETETKQLTAFGDPEACNNAPKLAHTLVNLTDQDITLFADDRCGVPLIDVRPGFGTHVAPDQSFAALGE